MANARQAPPNATSQYNQSVANDINTVPRRLGGEHGQQRREPARYWQSDQPRRPGSARIPISRLHSTRCGQSSGGASTRREMHQRAADAVPVPVAARAAARGHERRVDGHVSIDDQRHDDPNRRCRQGKLSTGAALGAGGNVAGSYSSSAFGSERRSASRMTSATTSMASRCSAHLERCRSRAGDDDEAQEQLGLDGDRRLGRWPRTWKMLSM